MNEQTTPHPAFEKGSWQHAVDDHLVGYGKTSQEFANPHEAMRWLMEQGTAPASIPGCECDSWARDYGMGLPGEQHHRSCKHWHREIGQAIVTKTEIMVLGEPDANDDKHDCDAMGCGTFSHVLYRAPLTYTQPGTALDPAEIKALTAMVWGAPCAGRDLAIVTSIVRAMEALRPGERPIDPAKGGRLLDVDACTVEPATATAPGSTGQVVVGQKVFTIGMQVEAWHVYGMQGPLTPEQRTAVIDFAHSFEECSETPDELTLMDDPELIATAYHAMTQYANGQI